MFRYPETHKSELTSAKYEAKQDSARGLFIGSISIGAPCVPTYFTRNSLRMLLIGTMTVTGSKIDSLTTAGAIVTILRILFAQTVSAFIVDIFCDPSIVLTWTVPLSITFLISRDIIII